MPNATVQNTNVIRDAQQLEHVARTAENLGGYVNRRNGEEIEVMGPNGKAKPKVGTNINALWAAFKMIGLIVALLVLRAWFMGLDLNVAGFTTP